MPFVKEDVTNAALGVRLPVPAKVNVEPEQEQDVPILDTFEAAFSLHNTVGSFITNEALGTGYGQVDPNFDPFEGLEGTKYEPFARRFSMANNAEEAAALKTQIDQEEEYRTVLDQSGGLGIAAMFTAGVLDPVNLLPVGSAARVAVKGGSLLKGAATAAQVGFVTEAASELALQSTQVTRTAEESVINIAGGTFLSGVIGGAATAITKKAGNFGKLEKGVETDLTIPPADKLDNLDEFAEEMVIDSGFDGIEDSVGAARAFDTTLDQETLIKSFGVARATSALNPVLRLAHSPSKATRQISQQLIENPVFFNKNIEGIATDPAVETLIKESQGKLANAIEFQRNSFVEFKKNAKKMGLESKSYTDFQEDVAKALRRGDVGENEFVSKTARSIRSEVLDPLKKQAIAEKLLPEDVDVRTAESYLTRIWDNQRIVQNEPAFRNTVSGWVRSQADEAIKKFDIDFNKRISAVRARLKQATTDAQKAKLQQQIDDILIEQEADKRLFFDTENNFDEYVDSVTDDIVRSLKGQDILKPSYDVKITTRGPLKERVFNIPDNLVEDFLVNDVERILARYTRVMGTDIELKKKFGSLTMDSQFNKINDDYQKLSDAAKTAKERKKIDARRQSDINDLQSMLEIMRGTSGKYNADPSNTWVRIGRQVRLLQYLSKLGGVTVSSFADVARPVMVHGYGRLFGDAIIPAIRGVKGRKLAVKEARLAGQVTENILGGRVASWADIGNPYAQGTAFERTVESMANGFSKVNLMSHWNNFWKATGSMMTQARIIDNVEKIAKGQKLKQAETRYMAFLGIDRDNALLMSRELKRASETVNGVRIANTERWESEELRRLFRAAINKDVDRTIVTKGLGDIPLFANSEVGKTLLQFKSFALASNQRMLIAGLQQGDMSFLNGAVFAATAGMATFAFKTWEKGEELPDDPNKWILEGIDRSGLIPVFMEVNNIAEKAGVPGISRLAGAEPVSRFASRNIVGNFFGPTSGTLTDLAVTSRALFSDELSESDVRAMRRLIPYQNLIGVRKIFDEAEKKVNQTLGTK